VFNQQLIRFTRRAQVRACVGAQPLHPDVRAQLALMKNRSPHTTLLAQHTALTALTLLTLVTTVTQLTTLTPLTREGSSLLTRLTLLSAVTLITQHV
jgi:hypothetical protein